jgi:multisubunit Na+/H+ antiporter MnhE subunit
LRVPVYQRVAVIVLFVTLTYLLVLGSFHPWDIAAGVIISCALLLFARRFVFDFEPAAPNFLKRFLYFWPFAAAVVWDITKGTWEVALITLHLRPLVSPGIVAIPIGKRTPTGVAVSALATTLSPGTFLVDVDRERQVMLIHTMDASDPDRVREDHQEFYRRYQSRVFP